MLKHRGKNLDKYRCMVRLLLSVILSIHICENAFAERDPAFMAMAAAHNRMNEARQRADEACRNPAACGHLRILRNFEVEDYGSKFYGLLESRAPSCQIAVGKTQFPRNYNAFANAADLQKEMAATYPEIGNVNHQRILSCANANDPSARYKVAKFYHHMIRFNEGATRAYEELSAINSLLDQNDPLNCEGKGVLDQAFNRCQQLQRECKSGPVGSISTLSNVAAKSVEDEKMYFAAKEQIKSLQRGCLVLAGDYDKNAKLVTEANPEVTKCENAFVERQAPRKICIVYSFAKKQEMAQCRVAVQNQMMAMKALEDANPWFRSNNYHEFRKTKTVEESIRAQMLLNRSELKKKVREFRNAGLCVNGFQSLASCDKTQVRSLLAATPEIEVRGKGFRGSVVNAYLEAQSCVEEGVRDQAQTNKILSGAARDATLTILTAGFSSIAMGAKAAYASRALSATRFAAMGIVGSIDAMYASESYAAAKKACAGPAQKLEVAARSEGQSCPGPKSNLAQAQQEHASCIAARGFQVLDALPLVPLLARTTSFVRNSPTVADAARTTTARVARALTPAPRQPRTPPSNVLTPAVTNAQTIDLPRVQINAQQISRERSVFDISGSINPRLEQARVVNTIENTSKGTVVDSFAGKNSEGFEILELDGKKLFGKIPGDKPPYPSYNFESEVFFAKKMDEMGIGPKFHGVVIGADGRYRIVTDLIEGTDVKPKANGEIVGNLVNVTDQTVRDIREINRKLIAAGIDPKDLQFRIDKNGKPFVVDTAMYNPLTKNEVAIAQEVENATQALVARRAQFGEVTNGIPSPAQEARALRESAARGADSASAEVPRATTRYTREAAAAEAAANTPKAIRDRFVAQFAGKKQSTVAENTEWIRHASRVEPDGKTKFFVVENAAMKDLNDTSLDKDLVTALTNKRIEMTSIAVNDLLKKYPNVQAVPYSDFKSMRFGFKVKPPAKDFPKEFDDDLKKLYEQTDADYAAFVKTLKLEVNLGDPKTWFASGYGLTGDQAAYAARDARLQPGNVVSDFNEPGTQARLNNNFSRVENSRNNLRNDPALSGLMDKEAGRSTLRLEVYEIARKTDSPAELRSKIASTLGVNIDEGQARRILDYTDEVDRFSASINIAGRERASLTDAAFGGISADVKGLGAQNLKETAEALARSKNGTQAIQDSRLGEAGVTAVFNVRKREIRNAVQEIADKHGAKVEIRMSGDDIVVIPLDAPFTPAMNQQISEALARKVPPSSLRVSTIPAGLNTSDRAPLSVAGEDIEKRLRTQLQGVISQDRLDRILFSVDMDLTPAAGRTANLRTSTNNMPISEEEMRKIRKAFENAARESGVKK